MLCCASSLLGLATSPWLLAGVALLAVLYKYVTWNFDHWRKLGVPFLQPEPFFGNVRERILFRVSFAEMHESIYHKLAPHPLGGCFEGRRPLLVVRDPDLLRTVMVRDFDCFVDRLTTSLKPGSVDESSLLFLKGSHWKAVRSLSTPIFSSGKLRNMAHLVAACADQMTSYLTTFHTESKELEMKEFFGRFTLDVIACCAFGIECDSLRDPQAEFVREVSRFLDMKPLKRIAMFISLIILGSPRAARLLGVSFMNTETITYLSQVVMQAKKDRIKEREEAEHNNSAAPKRVDFLQLLLDAQAGRQDIKPADQQEDLFEQDAKLNLQKTASKEVLTDSVLVGQSLLFLFAGFETSSTLLSCAAYELALHPELQERARREVRAALAKHPEDRHQALQDMPFLENVLLETLRKHPPVSRVERVLTCDEYTLSGVQLRRGDVVVIPVRGLHRDPVHYPDPEIFDPERFSPEARQQRSPYVFLPFGSGPRNCIGMRFAMMSSKIALASLLQKFSFEPCARTEVPFSIAKAAVFLKAANGIHLTVRRLQDAAEE